MEGFTAASGGDPALVKTIWQLTVLGDHNDPTPNQAWSTLINGLGGNSTTVYLPDVGIFGNGHTMMLQLNNEQIAEADRATDGEARCDPLAEDRRFASHTVFHHRSAVSVRAQCGLPLRPLSRLTLRELRKLLGNDTSRTDVPPLDSRRRA